MNFPSVNTVSVAKGPSGITAPEMYIPLLWLSGTYCGVGGGAFGSIFLMRGGGTTNSYANSAAEVHTFNSNWPSTLQVAFEATLWSGTSGSTANAELWDSTSNVAVSSSQISTTSTTATIVRSGKFTLTPGHKYSITVQSSAGVYTNLTDASLIVFPS